MTTQLSVLVNVICVINISIFIGRASKTHRPRILFCGNKGSGLTSHVAPALLYDLEGFPVHVLDIPVLYGNSTRTPEEACAQVFTPSVIFSTMVR